MASGPARKPRPTRSSLRPHHFRLADPAATKTVVTAFSDAAARGVTVRIGYDAGKPAQADAATFAALEADPAPAGTAQWVTESSAGTNVEVRAITGGHQLMRSKYLVRDAGTPGATDAWTQQENNVITIANGPLATAYRTDFDQLWAGGVIAGTGAHSAGTSTAGVGDLATWQKVSQHRAVKHSVPYTPTSAHNFMRLKVLVSDDTLTTGSYNFSANAERNAENQLHLTDPGTVATYTDYLGQVIDAYR